MSLIRYWPSMRLGPSGLRSFLSTSQTLASTGETLHSAGTTGRLDLKQPLCRECAEKVKEYFEKNDLNPKGAWAGVWRMALVFAVAGYCFCVMNNLATVMILNPWIAKERLHFLPKPMNFVISNRSLLLVKIIAAIVFGSCQAIVLLHMMHDCSHGATSYIPRVWQLLGRVTLDFFAGCSFTSWLYQHVVGHHVYTNVFLADPDLPATKEGDLRRLVDRQVTAKRQQTGFNLRTLSTSFPYP